MSIRNFAILMACSILFFNCNKDEDSDRGQVSVEITDAPADDSNIEAVFVTVADVKIDGESMDGFSGKQTIDIMAYQNGNVKALGLGNIDAEAYNEITIVLDYDTDATGNSPGCYVETTDNMKHDLSGQASGTAEIAASGAFEVMSDMQTDIVVDFDIRKAIRRSSSSSNSSDYEFVSSTELSSSLRTVAKANAGMITGTCNDNSASGTDKIVVYAYKKGSFNSSTETSGQGESSVMFANAVTSAEVDANGEFTLAFLESGDYEVHAASYQENSAGGFDFQGVFEASTLLGGLGLTDLSVEANAELSLSISLTSIL